MRAIHERIKTLLANVKEAGAALLILTEGLSLFDPVSDVARRILVAQESLSSHQEALQYDPSLGAMVDTEAAGLLDEIVDGDVISELEERLFGSDDSTMDDSVAQLLSELLEKVERKYVRLIESVHQLNAVLDRNV